MNKYKFDEAVPGQSEPVRQVYRGGFGWHDVGYNEYIGTAEKSRRILYTAQPAPDTGDCAAPVLNEQGAWKNWLRVRSNALDTPDNRAIFGHGFAAGVRGAPAGTVVARPDPGNLRQSIVADLVDLVVTIRPPLPAAPAPTAEWTGADQREQDHLDSLAQGDAAARIAAPTELPPLAAEHCELLNDLYGTASIPAEIPQPFAGVIVLLETFAEIGMTAKRDGKPTPNSLLCLRFATELRAALAARQAPSTEAAKEPDELAKRLRIKAGMITMGELISWGSDAALMNEAASKIEALSVRQAPDILRDAALEEAAQVLERNIHLLTIPDHARRIRALKSTAAIAQEQAP